jgi:hypothetical protein
MYRCTLGVSGHLHGPVTLIPGKQPSGTHWIGGWVGPRADLDDVEKRKFLTLPGLELRLLGRPARSQSLCQSRYPGSCNFPIPYLNSCTCYVSSLGLNNVTHTNFYHPKATEPSDRVIRIPASYSVGPDLVSRSGRTRSRRRGA